MENKPRRADPEVFTITSAAVSHSEELGHRQRRYLISMMIRTACFLAAVAVDGWPRWVFLAGAILLPYTSVVLANAGVRKKGAILDLVEPDAHGELAGGKQQFPAADAATKKNESDA